MLREIQALTQKEDFLTAKTSCQSGPALVTPSYAYPTQNSPWADNSETIQQENNNREMTSLGDISQADDRVKKFYGIPTNAANGNAGKSSGSSSNNNNADKRSVRMVKRDSKERVATGPTSSGGSSIRNSSSSCEDLNSGGSDGSTNSSGAAGRQLQTGALIKNSNVCPYFVLVS